MPTPVVVGTIVLQPRQLAKTAPTALSLGVLNAPQGRVLAELYGQTLAARGIRITYKRLAGSVDADHALTAAKIDLYVGHLDDVMTITRTAPATPVTTGPATTVARSSSRRRRTQLTAPTAAVRSLGPLPPATADPARTVADLNGRLFARHQVALLPAGAGHPLTLAGNTAVAREDGVATVSDLRRSSFRRRLAGPYRCSEDDRCALLLRRSYGLAFKAIVEFGVPPSAGSSSGTQPRTRRAAITVATEPPHSPGSSEATEVDKQALAAVMKGDADYTFIRSDNPSVTNGSVVVLVDDRRAFPAGNFVPILRLDLLSTELLAAIDTVSAGLTDEAVDNLVDDVEGGAKPRSVVATWLRQNGLIGPRQS